MSKVASKINLDTLTLENFREQTGHRFRMTTEQKSRDLTREVAFQEWLSKQRTVGATAPADSN